MWVMRVHVHLDDELVRELDEQVGPRGRSAFIEAAVRKELDQQDRWAKIWSAVGTISDEGHEWDDDLARWVHDQRRSDPRRVG